MTLFVCCEMMQCALKDLFSFVQLLRHDWHEEAETRERPRAVKDVLFMHLFLIPSSPSAVHAPEQARPRFHSGSVWIN